MTTNELREVTPAGPVYWEGKVTCLDCPATWDSETAHEDAQQHAIEHRHVVNVEVRATVTFWPWEEQLLANLPTGAEPAA